MTEPISNNSDSNPSSGEINSEITDEMNINAEQLLILLRQKQENWLSWGSACQQLQKTGYSPQAIFEATGFEPIQQNQIIVAMQVHASIVSAGAGTGVIDRFQRTGSDILYELRILTQPERLLAAEFIVARGLDSTTANEVAKAMKDFSRLGKLPEGFSRSAGDMVAYQYWKLGKQQTNLQERSRLVVRGLMFAETQSAREKVEQILTGVDPGTSAKAPILPIYRLEAEEELPRLVSLAGSLTGATPLNLETWQQTPSIPSQGIFGVSRLIINQDVVALPGWSALRKAVDPVAVITERELATGAPETLLLVIDRSIQTWNQYSHCLFLEGQEIRMGWFGAPPTQPILGQLILVLRPKYMIERAVEVDSWELED